MKCIVCKSEMNSGGCPNFFDERHRYVCGVPENIAEISFEKRLRDLNAAVAVLSSRLDQIESVLRKVK